MSEVREDKQKRPGRLASFRALSGADKRRRVTDILFNNAMYIVIAVVVIYIAVREPGFLSTTSIINMISLTAAKLPIAL